MGPVKRERCEHGGMTKKVSQSSGKKAVRQYDPDKPTPVKKTY